MSNKTLDEVFSALISANDMHQFSLCKDMLRPIFADHLRWQYAKNDPESARHLLSLLAQGKGDGAALDSMVDRINASIEAARVSA